MYADFKPVLTGVAWRGMAWRGVAWGGAWRGVAWRGAGRAGCLAAPGCLFSPLLLGKCVIESVFRAHSESPRVFVCSVVGRGTSVSGARTNDCRSSLVWTPLVFRVPSRWRPGPDQLRSSSYGQVTGDRDRE